MPESYRLGEIEAFLSEHELESARLDEHGIILSDDCILELDCSPGVLIPSLGLVLRSGTVSVKSEDSGEFEPDFCVTVIYDGNHEDWDEYLLYEQDGFVVSLHNFLWQTGRQLPSGIESEAALPCEILPRE